MNHQFSHDRVSKLCSMLVTIRASPDNDGGRGAPGVLIILPSEPLIEAIMPALNFRWPLAFYVG